MKKTVYLLLSALILIGITSCDNDNDGDSSSASTPNSITIGNNAPIGITTGVYLGALDDEEENVAVHEVGMALLGGCSIQDVMNGTTIKQPMALTLFTFITNSNSEIPNGSYTIFIDDDDDDESNSVLDYQPFTMPNFVLIHMPNGGKIDLSIMGDDFDPTSIDGKIYNIVKGSITITHTGLLYEVVGTTEADDGTSIKFNYKNTMMDISSMMNEQ